MRIVNEMSCSARFAACRFHVPLVAPCGMQENGFPDHRSLGWMAVMRRIPVRLPRGGRQTIFVASIRISWQAIPRIA